VVAVAVSATVITAVVAVATIIAVANYLLCAYLWHRKRHPKKVPFLFII